MQPQLTEEQKRRLEEKNRQAQTGMSNMLSGAKELFVPSSAPPPTNTSPEERARAQAMQQQVPAPVPLPTSAPAPAAAPVIKDDLQEGGTPAVQSAPAGTQPANPLAGFYQPTKVASTVTTTQPVMDLTPATKAQTEADKKLEEATALKKEKLALQGAERWAQVEKEAVQTKELEARRVQNLARQEQVVQEFNKQFDEYANSQISNPWSNMSTGAKIMSAISIGLGGLGAGPGGKNIGLDIVNQNIERDIELQKANMDKKKGQLTILQEYGQQLRAQGLNDQQVTEGMIALGQKLMANKFDAMATQLKPNDARSPKMAEFSAGLAQQAADRQFKIAEAKKSTVTTTDQTQIGGTGQGAGGVKELSEKETSDLITQQKALRGFKRLDTMAKANDGEIGLIMGTLNKYRAKFNAASGDFYKLDTKTQDAIAEALKAQSGAQLTDKEIEWLKSYFPSTTMDVKQFRDRLAALAGPALEDARYDLNFRASMGQNVKPFLDQLNRDFPPTPNYAEKTN